MWGAPRTFVGIAAAAIALGACMAACAPRVATRASTGALDPAASPSASAPVAPVDGAASTKPSNLALAFARDAAGPDAAPSAPASSTPVAAAPPPPPYDLAADRERIVARAREELGAGVLTAVVSDVFVLIGPPGSGRASLRAGEKLVRDAVTAYLHGRFDRGPDHAIAVYLFPTAPPYNRFCRAVLQEPCISPFGFYWQGRMIMNTGPGLGTLTHELVHPFVDADFPRAPIWINEGIASLYEAPVLGRPGEIHGVKNWRYPRLLRALSSAKGREATRLDRLFSMTDEAFRDDEEDLHYALARYVCQWLDEKKLLWPFYRRWRDTVAGDETGQGPSRTWWE